MQPVVTALARWIVLLVISVSALASGGCSFMFVDGPPKRHRQLPYFTCTTSRGWPVVDTVFAGLYGLSAISAFANADSDNDTTTVGAVTGGLAALFIASAVSGYSDASQCREATEDLQLRLIRMHSGPGFAPSSDGPPPNYDPWQRPADQPFGRRPGQPLPSEGAKGNDSDGER